MHFRHLLWARDCLNRPLPRPLRAGQEGFAGNSTPLYMYSNPGAWASLMGVDYVRNNKAKGIDYSTMHVYTDQWLCVAEGATTQGQIDFMKQWIEARIQAAEEELEMPVVLEEFGSKLDKRCGQRVFGNMGFRVCRD